MCLFDKHKELNKPGNKKYTTWLLTKKCKTYVHKYYKIARSLIQGTEWAKREWTLSPSALCKFSFSENHLYILFFTSNNQHSVTLQAHKQISKATFDLKLLTGMDLHKTKQFVILSVLHTITGQSTKPYNGLGIKT